MRCEHPNPHLIYYYVVFPPGGRGICRLHPSLHDTRHLQETKALQIQLDQAVWGLERQEARRLKLVLKRVQAKHSLELAALARSRGDRERAELSRVEDEHAATRAVELSGAAAAAEVQLAAELADLARGLTATIIDTMTTQRELALEQANEQARQRHAAALARASRALMAPQAAKMHGVAEAHLQQVDGLSTEIDAAAERAAELAPNVDALRRQLATLAHRNRTLERSSVLAGLAGRAPVEFPDPHADQRAGHWFPRPAPGS